MKSYSFTELIFNSLLYKNGLSKKNVFIRKYFFLNISVNLLGELMRDKL